MSNDNVKNEEEEGQLVNRWDENGNYWSVCIEKTCQRNWYLKPDEQRFYNEQGYVLPKRCWNCRKKRKKMKKNRAKAAFYSSEEKSFDKVWGQENG